ncbi:MAG: hypothetical protein LBD50_01720 [Rickettsiales bacterium]|jgi:hypothetical protein|nr:hypothetical protein [Rickettsiales bacterium]
MEVFAGARLPVVNIAAGSVSARAAFGETPEKHELAIENQTKKNIVSNKDVSARSARPAANDILSPRKPSGDLWARLDKPLRLPEPQEFSVVQSDFVLPEESLKPHVAAREKPKATLAALPVGGNLDAEIANLVELQRKADESVRASKIENRKPAVKARAPAADITDGEEITLSRVIVPAVEEPKIVPRPAAGNSKLTVRDETDLNDFTKMSPGELKKAFKKTYLSENKHLSTYKIDDRFDVASDVSSSIEGFTSSRDLSEADDVRTLEIKIGFRGDDSALSRDNYNLLSKYAGVIISNPKRAIQISIPERATRNLDGRKLAARRLAIVEQVLRDTGISDQRIMPVLSQRSDDSFVLRAISSDQFETMTQQKRDMFGDTVGKKTYKSMTW